MKLIKFVLVIVLLWLGFYSEAIAEDSALDRVTDRNLQRAIGRAEGEYRAAEQGYNSIKEQIDKIDTEIEGLNNIIENSQSIINQIEMGVFNCTSDDFSDFRRGRDSDGGYIDRYECISYIRNRERQEIQASRNKITELEYKKKPLREQLPGAKSNLDEKKDNYTVAQETYDAFNKRREELKQETDKHNVVMKELDSKKRTVIQSNEQILNDNSQFLNEKPQYHSPRTWRPKSDRD